MTTQQLLTLAAMFSGLAMLIVGLVTDIEVLSRVLVIAGAFTLVFNLVQLVRRSSEPRKNGDQA